ncbi:gamma carbonic anhydrase family protein [Pseudonocardiaceae bacterium YIM PH 21723]|nr:gamma carbonic anhydrase family protein [Pseudonocardiaceae bacterium YIM PH 21723]
MPIYALGDLEPTIHPDAYVHPDATVIGNVTLGAFVSVWPQAVLRGDYGSIEIGERSNIQDGSILHTTEFTPVKIGTGTVVGHNVHIEGATIGNGCLIASGSVVLNGTVVEDGALVGAGAVISFGGHVPAKAMALGVPAKIREGHVVDPAMTEMIVQKYVENIAVFKAQLRRLD